MDANKALQIDKIYKTCTLCGFVWESRHQMLCDPNVVLVGYQVNFEQLVAGLFLFNHSCGTTFSLPAKSFRDLYDGEVFIDRAVGSDQCPGHCLHKSNLMPCPAQCECAFVREIIKRIKNWPKTSGGPLRKLAQT
jgi:hypothetical protein